MAGSAAKQELRPRFRPNPPSCQQEGQTPQHRRHPRQAETPGQARHPHRDRQHLPVARARGSSPSWLRRPCSEHGGNRARGLAQPRPVPCGVPLGPWLKGFHGAAGSPRDDVVTVSGRDIRHRLAGEGAGIPRGGPGQLLPGRQDDGLMARGCQRVHRRCEPESRTLFSSLSAKSVSVGVG